MSEIFSSTGAELFSNDVLKTLGSLGALRREMAALSAQLNAVQPTLDVLAKGLPDNVRIVVDIEWTTWLTWQDEHPPTAVYYRNPDGYWTRRGSVIIVGRNHAFYGTGGIVDDDGNFVIIDLASGVGISTVKTASIFEITPASKQLASMRHTKTIGLLSKVNEKTEVTFVDDSQY